MNAVATVDRSEFDPSKLGFPPMLPVELAMRTDTVPNICKAYDIDRDEFAILIDDPLFVAAYRQAQENLKKDGVSFRLKAKMQAEALLGKSWQIIHAPETPNTAPMRKNTDRPRRTSHDPGSASSARHAAAANTESVRY